MKWRKAERIESTVTLVPDKTFESMLLTGDESEVSNAFIEAVTSVLSDTFVATSRMDDETGNAGVFAETITFVSDDALIVVSIVMDKRGETTYWQQRSEMIRRVRRLTANLADPVRAIQRKEVWWQTKTWKWNGSTLVENSYF
ncbi:hypothetical protein C8R42DRAFT_644602 [Lentinula raphanica]|nr:hypothetical protein C8R42DRAFT_644602 [Lentinula raphanica]